MERRSTVPKLDYDKYKLGNGLDVILLEDHRLPLVAVNIWYHVGPANERPGLTGFAHLFEHMMFEGSKYVGEKGHFLYLEAAGASDINGTTDFDRTNYFETLPSDRLELALWLESDRMGFLLEKLDAERLENQRDVVRNERRQSIEGVPYGLVQEEVCHLLFPREHPYYASVIGSHADIEAARLEDVREFFRLYYAPNNASLAVVGDIDIARAKALIDKYFGPLLQGTAVPPVGIQTPPITSERRAIIADQVELPRVYLAWITDPIFTQGDAECDIAARILGGGKSSRLFKRLVYEKRIAQDISAHQYSLALGSIFSIECTAKPGVTPENLQKELDDEIDSFLEHGPTDEELEGARNTIETTVIRGLETLGGFGGVADRLNQYNHFLSDPGYLPKDLERYEKASTGSVGQCVRRLLQRNARVVVYGIPGSKTVHDVPKSARGSSPPAEQDSQEPPDQPWRAEPPPPGESSSLNLPVPFTFKLSNGLTVYLVEQHTLPIVSANMVVLSGSERNQPDLPGLASFTAEMMDEGTKTRSALAIARDAEHLGASISTGSSADLSFVAVRALRKNLQGALELASDVLLNAEFPAEEIERIRHDRLTHILQQKDNPNSLATKAFFSEIYGSNHPYGYTEIGTEESNRATSREAMIQFWKTGYLPAASALVVAGDVTPAELRDLAEKYFGSWTGERSHHQPPTAGRDGSRRIVIVHKPDAPQTVLRIGHVGIARSNSDYVPVDVMNTALGGMFSSRINLNLREKNGFTYGASSGFMCMRGPGPFLVGTGVRTDVTAEAVREIFKEIEQIRAEEPSEMELSKAKAYIARSLPGSFETTPEAASSIGQIFVHELPDDYYRLLPDQIEGVAASDVRRVAGKYLKPDNAVIVAVGDREKIAPQLEKLDMGPILFRDANGRSA